MANNEQLDRLVQEVLASPKYRAVSADAVRSIGARELAAHRTLKDAVKATRNKLHQVAGAYLPERPRYEGWLTELEASLADDRHGTGAINRTPNAADAGHSAFPGLRHEGSIPHSAFDAGHSAFSIPHSAFKAACQRVMSHHASTRERLPILEQFYATLLGDLPPVQSLLDLACGLNPLALPWMPLAPEARYYACDLYSDMAAFLNHFFALAQVQGQAETCDLLAGLPLVQADLALALKLLPVLEQRRKGAAIELLRAVNAPYIVVSFPTHTLGGRGKAMASNYHQWFSALAEAEGWPIRRYDFPGELAYVVQR